MTLSLSMIMKKAHNRVQSDIFKLFVPPKQQSKKIKKIYILFICYIYMVYIYMYTSITN